MHKDSKIFIRAVIKSNQGTDINSIKNIFRNKYNKNTKLTNLEIYHEKNLALGKLNNLDLISICHKISNENLTININSIDITYNYKKTNNKIETRK